MDFTKHIFSRGLPKTGQETVYVTGDDGTFQAGWWLKRTIANNRTRFIGKTIDGDVVVFDRATGLCWAGDGNEAGCNNGATITWVNTFTYALALDFAGFTDWRMPNIKELFSIVIEALNHPVIVEPPFINTVNNVYWSATTRVDVTTKVWSTNFDTGFNSTPNKTDSYYLRCVRKGL